MIEIYTDGSSTKAKSGIAFVVLKNKKFLYAWREEFTEGTNQAMELAAAMKACFCADKLRSKDEEVFIYSDSAYLINCYLQKWYLSWQSNGWINSKEQPVVNKKLWEKLIPFFLNPFFNFIKVKGHQDNKYNIIADNLATGKFSVDQIKFDSA